MGIKFSFKLDNIWKIYKKWYIINYKIALKDNNAKIAGLTQQEYALITIKLDTYQNDEVVSSPSNTWATPQYLKLVGRKRKRKYEIATKNNK